MARRKGADNAMNSNRIHLYETHLHTAEASACARWTGAEAARACRAAGYTGIVVTDHFVGGNTGIDRSLPWIAWVNAFEKGYLHAKQEGDRIGLQVFFGWEAGYKGTEFLVYGPDADWLRAHPEIRDATVEEQFRLIRAESGLVVHAHPFREEPYIPAIRLFPDLVDAVEVCNATHSSPKSVSHNQPSYDRLALAYAQRHGLPMTAGSDIHSSLMLDGGMAFHRRLTDLQDLIRAIREREPCFLLDGSTGSSLLSGGPAGIE